VLAVRASPLFRSPKFNNKKMENEKAIKVIKEIRKREDEMFKQSVFCREHNFNLEAEKFKAIEDELRRICRMLENELETGYVSYPD
jgi:hypothetical protein